MFSSLRQCAEGMTQPFWQKVKVTLEIKCLILRVVPTLYLLNSLKEFHKTWFECSVHCDDV